MASVNDVKKVADDLESLVRELRDEVKNGRDFERLVQIADEISERADNAAQTFSSVNDALMEPWAASAAVRRNPRGAASPGAGRARCHPDH
jgi:hypothetical protein